ncbi:hypothetical protein BH23ACT6_BH23ACT6_11440 [soil metagenome]
MPFIASAASGGESGSFSLIILALPLALLAYLIFAQRRRAKREARVQEQLSVGDAVMTRAGMFGVITALDGPTVMLRVAPEVDIRCDRRAVIPATIPTSPSADDTGDSDAYDSGQD